MVPPVKTSLAVLLACSYVRTGESFAPPAISRNSKRAPSQGTRLNNIPPPSTDDPIAVKEAADREAPPSSFYQLQLNSARAAQLAMDDGHKLIEIEFPPLPAQVLEMDDVSAYDVSRANIDLAVDFGKFFAQSGKRVTIMLPDEAEVDIAVEAQGTESPYPGIVISSLRKSEEGSAFRPENLFLDLFGSRSGSVKPVEGTDIYMILVASAQELPDVEELSKLEPDATIVFYNLKLDILRGDLGAPAFPSKVRFLFPRPPVLTNR